MSLSKYKFIKTNNNLSLQLTEYKNKQQPTTSTH